MYIIGERFFCLSKFIYNWCQDTFWIESFNHQLLPKLIHFGSTTFKMRMNLAVMDWVCSCNCVHTCYIPSLISRMKMYKEPAQVNIFLCLRRPDRITPMKVIVKKTFHFVDVWRAYIRSKITDFRLAVTALSTVL